MTRFGLIGKTLGHSFSKDYHNARFTREGINARYDNYELETAAQVTDLFAANPALKGVNVTVPHKTQVMRYLDVVDPLALEIHAVNTIVKTDDGLIGFNTDLWGFTKSLQDWLGGATTKALVLGTGGASKAVQCALDVLEIEYQLVSRKPSTDQLGYENLNDEVLGKYHLIINCTPLGMAPATDTYPPIPYERISDQHWVYDLVYNPEKTIFLQRAAEQGGRIKNGLEMLHLQADKAWQIWQSYL